MACFYAPNGQLSNLYEEAKNIYGEKVAEKIWRYVRTPQFISKFGNWKDASELLSTLPKDSYKYQATLSKYSNISPFVDNNFEPKLVYLNENTNKSFNDILKRFIKNDDIKKIVSDIGPKIIKKARTTQIKEGVTELFESNPELANAVYEILDIKQDDKITKDDKYTLLKDELDKILQISDEELEKNEAYEFYYNFKSLASLIKNKLQNYPIKVYYKEIESGVIGTYSEYHKRIIISPNQNYTEKIRTLLHEAIHALTRGTIVDSIIGDKKFYDLIDSYRKKVINKIEETKGKDNLNWNYQTSDNDEFLAAIFTEPLFRDILKSIPSEKSNNKTLWDDILDLIKKLIGIKGKNTLLEDVINDTLDNLEDFKNKKSLIDSDKKKAQQLYSQYLDSVFPDSKVKDIVYHGTDKNDIEFIKNNIEGYFSKVKGGTPNAIFFSKDKAPKGSVYDRKYNIPVILNIKNSFVRDDKGDRDSYPESYKTTINNAEKNGYDGVQILNTNDNFDTDIFVVFDPNQIYKLGSQQDIEGFKEFASDSIIKKGRVKELFGEIRYQESLEDDDVVSSKKNKTVKIEINKEIKDIINNNNFEKGEYEVMLVNGIQTFINLKAMPETIKKGYNVFYSDYLKGQGLIKRAGKKLTVPGFEDIQVMLDQKDKSVIELSTGLMIPTKSSTQSKIIEELENIFKTKNIRSVLQNAKKINANQLDTIISELKELPVISTINIYSTDKNGFEKLSNILNGPVVAIVDGKELKFKTVEHLYQVKKALFAGDRNAANKIYTAENGFDAQQLGSKKKGIIEWKTNKPQDWDNIAAVELESSMRLSFEQNKEMRDLLVSTGDAKLTHKKENINLGKWEQKFPEILEGIRNDINLNKPLIVNFDDLTEFTNERKEEIIFNFSNKHKMTEDKAKSYINEALKKDKDKVINKLKDCY